MSSPKLKESLALEPNKSSQPGKTNRISGTVARVKITIDPDFTPIVPVLVPDLDMVRTFAAELHRKNVDWRGSAFGWDAEYLASRPEQPPDSKMTFTPAEFWIGDATVWGFSMMWEDGDNQPASEALSDWNLVEKILDV